MSDSDELDDHVPGAPAEAGSAKLWWLYLKADTYFRLKRLTTIGSVVRGRVRAVRDRRIAEWYKEQAYRADRVVLRDDPPSGDNIQQMMAKLRTQGTAYADTTTYLMDQQATEDSRLRVKAERYGVMIPAEYEPAKDPSRPEWNSMLTIQGRTWVRGEVRKARRASFKSWNEVILPILSLVVALVALLKRK